LRDLAAAHPGKLAARLEFSEGVAHRIEAASDLFLMPSRYEPCGLNQLYSLKYGTVPVVHATGGLADTVVHASESALQQGRATGFQFSEYTLSALENALDQALDFCLHRRPQWAQIVRAGMQNDWSWRNSAQRYQDLYRQLHSHNC
jgi:starch synthase